MKKEKCYNAGKVGGLSAEMVNKNFAIADANIGKMGYIAVNPLNNGLKEDANYWLHMAVDIFMLAGCKAACFQTNWKDSRGARIEHRFARLLGKRMLYQECRDLSKISTNTPFKVGREWYMWREYTINERFGSGVCLRYCKLRNTPQCRSAEKTPCFAKNRKDGMPVLAVRI